MAVGDSLHLLNNVAHLGPACVIVVTEGARPRLLQARHQYVDALPTERTGGHHWNPQQFLQLLHVNLYALMAGLVPYVESYNDRSAGLEQLEGQVQIPLQVSSINHIDNQVALSQHVDGHFLGPTGWLEAIGAGDINYLSQLAVKLESPLGEFDGSAGIIRDYDPSSREPGEDNTLAHVRVAHQQDALHSPTRTIMRWAMPKPRANCVAPTRSVTGP